MWWLGSRPARRALWTARPTIRATPISNTIEGALTFAIPDLHGRLDLLDAALDAIAAYSDASAGRKVVFLGDYVDRGPRGADVISKLVAGPSDGWDWVCLKGNHEAMMSVCMRDPEQLDWWFGNGGDATIQSYGRGGDRIGHHLEWIDALPLIHVERHRIFVHAGVDPALPIESQVEKTLLWKRYPPDETTGHGDRHVVHGHDPNMDGPLCSAGRTDLDTYAWATGRLVIGVFDDGAPGGPIDLLEVRGPPA